jgi:transcriptional regulator with XRE-family HTH domain
MKYQLTLADRIRSARRVSSISRQSIAQALGISCNAVAQWEHPDGTIPTIDKLVGVARLTRVSFEWLATGDGDMFPGDSRPAFTLEVFAQDADEELLLAAWRRLKPHLRSALKEIICATSGTVLARAREDAGIHHDGASAVANVESAASTS